MTLPQLPLLFLALAGNILCSHGQSTSHNEATGSHSTTQMDPYSVSALFSAIEVRFTLSGKNLFHPDQDTVKSAHVVRTEIRDFSSIPLVKKGDQLIGLDDLPLEGRTLEEIADQLRQSRASGMPLWKIRRGLQSITVKFDGDWLTPLPGLKR